MLARNSLRIVSRIPDFAVMMATTWIMDSSCSSADALEDAVMATGQMRADFGRPVAKTSSFLPIRTLEHIGRIDLVDRQVALHAGHGRVLEAIARCGADARHLP